jgi:CheY-like chemotaxis protein
MTLPWTELHFLLVGNNQHMLRLLQTILHSHGVKAIQSVRDGQQAIAALRDAPPDVMIAEWIMAPMDGLDLTRAIRRSEKCAERRLPILLMTGVADGNLLPLAINAGASAIVLKPLHAKSLIAAIDGLTIPLRPSLRHMGDADCGSGLQSAPDQSQTTPKSPPT